MKKWLLLILASLMLVVAGCGDKEEDPVDDQPEEEEEEKDADEEAEDEEPAEEEIDVAIAEEALDVLEQNNEYANAQDVDGYLQAIPADMQEQQREMIEEMFAQGQIELEIIDYNFDAANEEEAVISVLQTTVAIDDIPGFQDNISEIQHTLRPEDGEWKIFASEVISSEPYGDEEASGAAGEVDEAIAEEVLDVLFANLDASNAGDIDGYLEAIPTEFHEVTVNEMEELFKEFDIEFDMLDYEVVMANEEEAQVYVVQTTVSAEPREDFDDNIAEVLHTFYKEDDEWKIYASDFLSVELYDGE